jgi:hypothetical protein
LYVLTDKYALPAQLKRDICARVRNIGRQARCVPDKDDVGMLWDCVLEDTESCSSTNGEEDGHANTKLKATVLGMYEALSVRSFKGLFFGLSYDAGGEGGGGDTRRDHMEVEGDMEWHSGFMRDLMGRMFEKPHASRQERSTKGEGTSVLVLGGGAVDDFGTGEEAREVS